ncbi:MAG: C-GCAxxG-C-C family (seleno)protein [Bacteroidales bacterium]
METKAVNIKGAKRLFIKLGSCSRTMAFIIDREFGNISEMEEKALDPLAGGILQQGYQCGMLWGAALAIGAEAYKTTGSLDTAQARAIAAMQHTLSNFLERTKTADCEEITHCDWQNKLSVAKHMLSGKVVSCFYLLQKWAPEAVMSAREGLDNNTKNLPVGCKNCASEVVRKMGGSEMEMAMVAGFAGGLGMSGNACGALAAAIGRKHWQCAKKTRTNHFSTMRKPLNYWNFFIKLPITKFCAAT